MIRLPLKCEQGHLFVEVEARWWLIDTGAPMSFGDADTVWLAGESFTIARDFVGLTAAALADFVGVPCAGLLGVDVLGRFDHLFDTAGGTLTLSTGALPHAGRSVPLSDCMGIPILTATIGGDDHRMFFDTGAQLSYFQDASLAGFPPAGRVNDFYPGLGRFQTDTHHVAVAIGGIPFTLRCGTLPDPLGTTLMMAGTTGIIGNQILAHRIIGYFPRRRVLIL